MYTPGELLVDIVSSKVFGFCLGGVFIEYGISRWQKKEFSWKEVGLILVISLGVRYII